MARFGGASWQAFVHWMPITSHIVLGEGHADFDRLQSLFGLVRAHGGSEALAWTVQTVWSLALAAGTVWLWRSRAPFDLKAAALAAGNAAGDAVPLYVRPRGACGRVCLFAALCARARLSHQRSRRGFAAAGALILAFPYVKTQVGLAAALIILALVVQRACCVATKSASH